MKAQSVVQVRTLAGLVDAPCYHQWKQNIGGMDLEFALHIEAGHAKGFNAPLAISELSTGFDTKANIRHAGNRLTTSNVVTLQSGVVKKIAHAALYHLVHRKVGVGNFLSAMLGAQMQISKIDLGKYEVSGTMTETYRNTEALDKLRGMGTPGTATFSATATPEQVALLDQMFGVCAACEGTKVLTTTDKDHEGQPIEVACTECAPKAIELPETKVGEMMAEQLRERRSHLQERADQHGTMTGDTGEGEYDEICEEIDDLTQKIADLEGTPCSN